MGDQESQNEEFLKIPSLRGEMLCAEKSGGFDALEVS